MQNRRKKRIRGLVVRPRPQFFLVSVIVGSFVCSQAFSVIIFTQWAKQKLADVIFHSGDLQQLHEQVIQLISHFLVLNFLISASTASIAAALSLKFTHRIFGPLIPILGMIQQLKAGNYKARVALRAQDELGEIEASLNSLASSLEKSVEGAK